MSEDTGRTGGDSEAEATAWERTLDQMETMAEERRADGHEVVTVAAADTAPTPPDNDRTDRWGLIYTVGSNHADEIAAVHKTGFERYEVYRRRVGGTLFLLTELVATDGTVLLVAGAVDTAVATPLAQAAAERGELYSHFQTLDWTPLGSVHHESPADFFPS